MVDLLIYSPRPCGHVNALRVVEIRLFNPLFKFVKKMCREDTNHLCVATCVAAYTAGPCSLVAFLASYSPSVSAGLAFLEGRILKLRSF